MSRREELIDENFDTQNLFVSFSGGKTSALMAKILVDKYKGRLKILTAFANTGQEDEETLRFVKRCDEEFELNLFWVESLVYHGVRRSSSFRITNYERAIRDRTLFEEMIKKYGIPNRSYPHCTRELKTNPLHAFAKSFFNGEDYQTAIGIRADEIDRMNPKYKKLRYVYPLIELGITKKDVNDFWKTQPFTLNIPEHLGNCTWCWKKNTKQTHGLDGRTTGNI